MMKKLAITITTISFLVLCTGFAGVAYLMTTNFMGLASHTEYKLDNSNITFTLPRIWEEVSSNNEELSLTKLQSSMQMKVYKKSELELVHAYDLLEEKIKTELANTESNVLLRDFGVNNINNRRIYSKLYSVEKEGIQTQYYFNIMEFVGSETYVYVLYETKEFHMKYHMSDINRMLRRMQWNGEELDLAMF